MRAQVKLEAILTFFIFIITIFWIFNFYFLKVRGVVYEIDSDIAELKAQSVAELLVLYPGDPSNWDSTGFPAVIGLTNGTPYMLSLAKVEKLRKNCTSVLESSGIDLVLIEIINASNNERIASCGSYMAYGSSIERRAFLNNNPVIVRVTAWWG